MIIQKKIEIFLNWNRMPQTVNLVQYDKGIQLLLIVADLEIPAGTTATLYVQKPSGNFVYQEKGVTVSGNTVIIELENQALTEYGEADYQVCLQNNGERVSTFAGIFRIHKSYADAGVEESKSVIAAFDTAITEKTIETVKKYLDENPDIAGYYYPVVEQNDDNSMELSFKPSEEWMDEVDPVTVMLPPGPKGEKGDDKVHTGPGVPPDSADVWLDPDGEPSGVELWEFELEDGSTVTRTVVVVGLTA